MGERLGTVERLEGKGVDALPFDLALATFEQHIASGSSGTVAITGRFGLPPGLEIGAPVRPPLRFVDRILVDFPGTELVAETELNLGRDPYLGDHCLAGYPVLPGVIGLEAMAQVVVALGGDRFTRRVSDVVFHRPIVLTRVGLKIRVAALRAADNQVEAAVFTEEDDFQAPYFSARFEHAAEHVGIDAVNAGARVEKGDSASTDELYGPLLFQGERFRRVVRLNQCTSRVVEADLAEIAVRNWFGAFEPSTLALIDPGVADAVLHVLQTTIPHRRVIPLSIAHVVLTKDAITGCRMIGRENWTAGDIYSFDITLYDVQGTPVASWLDARFKAVNSIDVLPFLAAAPAALLCAHLERLARESLDDDAIRLSLVSQAGMSRSERRRWAIGGLGLTCEVVHRADRRPVLASGEGFVSLSHCGDTSLAIYGSRPVACDLAALDARYPDIAGRGLSAAEWVEAEVRRKLGEPRPFTLTSDRQSFGGADPSRSIVISRLLHSFGMAIGLGESRFMAAHGGKRQTKVHTEVIA